MYDFSRNLYTYKKGVSLILRDSLPLPSHPAVSTPAELASEPQQNICVTDHRGRIREPVGAQVFEYPASSFFQNNNAILPSLTSYVRSCIFSDTNEEQKLTHLVDAYCGAGLFAISLAPSFVRVAGIELSAESIAAATTNAALNALPPPSPSPDNVNTEITFRAGDAANIFSSVPDFPPAETALVIDPPRKGCDEPFIEQLLRFGARTVVYVSCNVHTQARDVGMILKRSELGSLGGKGKRYVLESVRGFDLFPQTAHVESVAVLRLVDNREGDGGDGTGVDVASEGQVEKPA